MSPVLTRTILFIEQVIDPVQQCEHLLALISSASIIVVLNDSCFLISDIGNLERSSCL
ncbi:unnamed protein product [Moneuplotes crassus]|uniref:Uncharacterized protein n=1 Tax=Euplotes crassus TaxID=5936 RepID=A0AAD1X7F5_EUPCR|nr:unnamed protein product [Moneuplotes crassus]